ncbi:MAG: glycosyltransferase [Planctomycetia bacterium]|nr:glycosyltransferase [Planctomycetia bacterium]
MRVLIDGQTFHTHEARRGIGVVLTQLANHLITHDPSTEWFVTTPNAHSPLPLKPAAQRRVRQIEVAPPRAGDPVPHITYSAALQKACVEHRIDVYWCANPLMPNVVLPTELQGPAIAATVYDLIPWTMRETYLDRWPSAARDEYLRRLRALPRWAEQLLFISESARQDYLRFDSTVADRSSVIQLAVDLARFQPRRAPVVNDASPYVLMMGGFDVRKNMDGALEAFATLVQGAPQEHAALRFVVACAYTPESKAAYEALAARLGVADRLEMLGFVADEELPRLYRGAAAFFFPSRYEGFGLPVLEAMACGLPIVTTRVSSIPEVAGELAFYCAPDDRRDMARALSDALHARHDAKLRQNAVARARTFHWADAAAAYSRAFRWIAVEQTVSVQAVGDQRPRVAYASPWVPQRSGIADNSLGLVDELRKFLDLTLFLPQPDSAQETYGLPVRPIQDLTAAHASFDTAIYHLGNNSEMHTEIYRVARHCPGVTVLHDFNIHPFLQHAFLKTPDEHLFYEAWRESHGKSPEEYQSGHTNVFDYPMCQAILKRSLATIVHSRWAGDQLAGIPHVCLLPLCSRAGTQHEDQQAQRGLRERLGVPPDMFVVSTMGFQNRLKRLPSVLAAIRGLVDRGYAVRLVVGGESLDPELRIEERIQALKLDEHVIRTGYLSDAEFDALIRLSDVVLNLRGPSMGESSGTMIRALGEGKALIVSNYQQFADFPDDVCWKADVDENEVPQLVALLEHLLRNPAARSQLGRNAQRWVRQYATYPVAALGYRQVINEVLHRKYSSTSTLPHAKAA